MHHRPAPAPRSGRRGVRLAFGALVSTVLTGLVLSVPVVSGASSNGKPFVALDSFAATSAAGATTHQDSPVVMGRDGLGSTSTTDASGDPTTAAPSTTTATSAAPAAAAPATSTPAPAPAPAPSPAAAKAPAPAAAAAAAPAATATAPAAPSVEGQVLALVNTQRAAAGCGALSADSGLAGLARAQSADMRDRHFFDHVNPDGLDPFQRGTAAGIAVRAENIAYGQPDAAAVMDAWMHSPGHRANILNCDLTRLGVGVAEGPGGPWWTQDFA